MSKVILVVFTLITSLTSIISSDCVVEDYNKVDCGYIGIDQAKCEAKGCCWKPSSLHYIPWCYSPGTDMTCNTFIFNATSPGFTSTDYQKMLRYFEANLNIQGTGAVAAGPGEGYFFDWARDEGLSMRSYMFLHDFDYQKIKATMDSYIHWVLKIQSETSPHGIDIRVEVKYNLPKGDVYTGPWCRPQTDGPGLRATALSMYAQILLDHGELDFVKSHLFTSGAYKGGAIKYDLDWVVNHWREDSCDLWEEIISNDFFWGRYTMRKGLLEGANVAERLGEIELALKYRRVAKEIEDTLDSHWNGSFVQESSNRPKDSAVVSAFIEGYNEDEIFKPTDPKVAATISFLNTLFCKEYLINQKDTKNGIPGVMHGRYEGDTFFGGNPWILLTANLARTYYRGAIYISKEIKEFGYANLSEKHYTEWKKALNLKDSNHLEFLSGENNDMKLAQALINAGDSVLQRVYYHVKDYDVHLSEQLDKSTGKEVSAEDLTWSYANVLVALKLRDRATEALKFLSNRSKS